MPRKKRSSKAQKGERGEKREVIEFLTKDPLGRNLNSVEMLLTALSLGELPHFERIILNADFDLRGIQDETNFEEIHNECEEDQHFSHLCRVSESRAYAKMSFQKNRLKFLILYEHNKMTRNEAFFFSQTFGQVICACYSALGLDMKTFPVSRGNSTDFEEE